MDFERDKQRINVEDDMLSNLSDDLIHKILSLISIKQAIETSALSSRWRYLWNSMRYLNFSTDDFSSLREFSKFVYDVLSHRDNLVEVYSVKLRFRGKIGQSFVKGILNYAISHNVQQLEVVCLGKDNIEFPLSLFSSQSLKHLSLAKKILGRPNRKHFMTLVSTWELPALTTLHLDQISLYDGDMDKCPGVISNCVNLKRLTLQGCRMKGSTGFNIFHSRLSELTLESVAGRAKFINVVAPGLKNLIIRGTSKKILVSAPDLAYFLLQGYNLLDFSTDGFHSLEKADICISYPQDPIRFADLLQLLHNVKVLALNLEIFELLCSSVKLISRQPSPFANLRSLKIYPVRIYDWELSEEKPTVSTEVKKYLLNSSPSATFTMIPREDILVERLMTELRELLVEEKDNIETNMGHPGVGNAETEDDSEEMDEPEQSPLVIKSIPRGWNNLSEEVEEWRGKAYVIIWKLEDIEKVLRKMSASKRAVIQPCVSRLLADADIIMKKITDYMKINSDESQSNLTDRFQKLATALQLSS